MLDFLPFVSVVLLVIIHCTFCLDLRISVTVASESAQLTHTTHTSYSLRIQILQPWNLVSWTFDQIVLAAEKCGTAERVKLPKFWLLLRWVGYRATDYL